MKKPDRVSAFPRQIHTLPLSWLSLSVGKRLLIVALSYGLGVAGLWFLFPLVHNGASMFLPIISACWLFRYRGMLISLVLNGVAFQLTYFFLLRGMLPDQAFVEGGFLDLEPRWGLVWWSAGYGRRLTSCMWLVNGLLLRNKSACWPYKQ